MADLTMMKNKEEMVEFLNNLGIEYRYGCYERKNPEACELLGEFIELVEQNIPKSTKLYRYTCDTYGLGKSCHCYANALFYGRGCKKDYIKSLDYYSKACLQGHAVSCFNAGQIEFNEHPEVRKLLPRDMDKAATLFEMGCNLNNAESCSYLAFLSISGFLGTRPPDFKKALVVAERGCELNDLNSCTWLAKKAYLEGLGCEKNEEKAKIAADKVKDLIDQIKATNPKINQMQRFT